MNIFEKYKKRTFTGQDEKGELFDVLLKGTEAISEEAFKELSNGKGDSDYGTK